MQPAQNTTHDRDSYGKSVHNLEVPSCISPHPPVVGPRLPCWVSVCDDAAMGLSATSPEGCQVQLKE